MINIPNDYKNFLLSQKLYVGVSGGKDSVSTCIILYENGIPFTPFYINVLYDNNYPADHVEHNYFVLNDLFNFFNNRNIKFDIITTSFCKEYFFTPIKSPRKNIDAKGKLRGFPIVGRCGICRDYKIKYLNNYRSSHEGLYIKGICKDEYDRNSDNSVLSSLGIMEYQTFDICRPYNLISPNYKFSMRSGCWFCPNAHIQSFAYLYYNFPDLFNELVIIGHNPNLASKKFGRYGEIDDLINKIEYGYQERIFMI